MSRFGGQSQAMTVAIAAATLETILQLVAAANHRVILTGYSMNGEGISNTQNPGIWDLIRQTTAGTSSAGTVTKEDDSIAETLLTTSLDTFTVEPTKGDFCRSHTVHPQTSLQLKEQFSREKIIGGGDRLALQAQYTQAQNVGVSMDFEE